MASENRVKMFRGTEENSMRKYCVLVLAFFAAALVSEAQLPQLPPNQSVAYDADRNANFLNYKTYKWVEAPGTDQLDELTASQLIGTLQVELTRKDLNKLDADNADLYIAYQITNGKQKPVKSETIGGAYGSDGASGSAGASVTTVHTGQLTLFMWDAATKKLIWRGTVANAIDADAKPEVKQKHMSQGIEKMLKKYPPPKK
jgi:hypothetical protein